MWVNYQEISNCCRPVLTYWLTDWRRQWLTDCWPCTAFCHDSFSLMQQLCTVGHGIFYMAGENNFFSQGSVATRLGCGGYLYMTVTNFLLSLTVKEFRKSVNLWWSYGQELGVLFFFLTHSVGAKFYCPHALDGGNRHIQISEKTLKFSSTLDSVIYDVSVGVIYTVVWAAERASGL